MTATSGRARTRVHVQDLLPRVDSGDVLSAAPTEAALAPAPGRETILLVEDDDEVRDLARELLEALGYTVLEVPDGHAALALESRRPEPIDPLMTDVIMPHMSGRVLAQRLRERRPDLRVL